MAKQHTVEIPRRIVEVAKDRMEEDLVIAIHGPRSVGKSTVLRRLARECNADIVDLDDLATRDAFTADPSLFVSQGTSLFLDEYQQVPESLDAIKAELNRSSIPGRFVITGSTRHDTLPPAAQALTGRLHILDLLPLSQGEMVGVRENFLEIVLRNPNAAIKSNAQGLTRSDYIERVCAGGFPLAIRREGSGRARWFDDYVRLSVERDVGQIAPRLRQASLLSPLLERLASQTGQVLNIAAIAEQIGMAKSTTEVYVRHLEAVYLLRRLPAWGKSLRSRVGKLPKIHIVDSGLAARLLRLTPARLAKLDPTAMSEFGHLLETFVVGEIFKQSTWLDEPVRLAHWRTRDGDEVDLLAEADDGRVVAFEVKASARVSDDALMPMRKLRSVAGEAFTGGFLLYTGDRSYTVDDRIHVVPINRLWTPISS